MKIIILSLALFSITSVFSQVGIGTTTVESSVILQLDATDKALLLPRVTNTAAIITPVNGMLIFDVSQNCIRGYQNGSWTACYASGTRAPVVVADTATVLEDATTTSINVIANDTDADGDNLTLVAVSTSGGGSVAINTDNVSVDYTPLANYNGTETITYSVSDGTFINTTGTLTVTITSVNDEPIAFADTATVLEDATTTSINVIANDTDADGDNLTLVAVSTSGGGSVAINTDNVSVDYTPLANYNGTETITYSVSDGTFINTTGTLTVTINHGIYTILDQYTNRVPTGTSYNQLTFYDEYIDAGSVDASPFVITKQTAHQGGILFYGSTELNSEANENTFRLTASTGNFSFISFNLAQLEANINGEQTSSTLPKITLTSSSGSTVTYQANVDVFTYDGVAYYSYGFGDTGVKTLNWDNVEWVDIKTQYAKPHTKDYVLRDF